MSDSDDDMPIFQRRAEPAPSRAQNGKPSAGATAVLEKPVVANPIISNVPAAKPIPKPSAPAKPPSPSAASAAIKRPSRPVAHENQPLEKRAAVSRPVVDEDSDDEDKPLSQRSPANGITKSQPASKKPAAAKPASQAVKRKPPPPSDDDDDDDGDDSASGASDDDSDFGGTRRSNSGKASTSAKASKPPAKRQKAEDKKPAARSSGRSNGKSGKVDEADIKWTTLHHSGVLFPPEYTPHGVKMLYNGEPVDLTPEQEEVATMFAVMLETDYMQKPVFIKNFWEGFKEVLGKKHVIQSLEKCDFKPIFDWHMAEREKKKEITKEEKERVKKERDAAEAKYKVALVDGREEPVGNFRVEPPGLFRGRGEHPKMGKIKKRIYPKDITINIGRDAPVPEHPYTGQKWKEVRHDSTVTWLAFWKDTVSNKDFKYVWLGATSSFKADSDQQKYEKARKLKNHIGRIRENYQRDWNSKDMKTRQMAIALYFIDKLALRAGHEKDDDEADTVGCCTLKVENVGLVPPHQIRFDFLGKDSIRYENTVEVHEKVYANIERFMRVDSKGKNKQPGHQLFDCFDATDLNKELKSLMDGLSVKVFRTYNASITLDRLLEEADRVSTSTIVDEKKAEYDIANKEVAILCNHQRSIPKAHENQMEKMQEKLGVLRGELQELEGELRAVKKAKGPTQKVENRLQKKRDQIKKAEVAARSKEDLKTVALGTSKINYMDPRITVAWCKRNDVPIEKIFNKSLLGKFAWAMDIEPEFKF